MAESSTTAGTGRFEVRVTSDSHFSWIRTRLSLERTMMSWLRTATALIGFGFAIDQYLSRVQQSPGAERIYFPHAPHYVGLALIASGIVALLISIRQYLWTVRYLGGGSFAVIAGLKQEGMHSPVLAVAILLICIGLFAFFAVLLHLA
jgi:putative membrane protein